MGINYKTDKNLKKNSYSSISTFDQCGFKYYLQYVMGKYIYKPSLASEFGTLCHWILQHIGLDLKQGIKPDYEQYKKDFYDLDIPKKDKYDTDGGVFGIKILQKRYAREFFEGNKDGISFQTKAENFVNYGMYRLENMLKTTSPGWEVWGCEQYFDVIIANHRFSGKIDRILYNEKLDQYIIEDIKTKEHPFKDSELVTPLQFVIYVKALCDMLGIKESQILCAYDLPICDAYQYAGSKGFVKRGVEKLTRIFKAIESEDFTPSPSPLCWWCQFNHGNPDAPKEGKGLCPYYSLWRPDHKTYDVANLWEGMERHKIIVQRLDNSEKSCKIDIDF